MNEDRRKISARHCEKRMATKKTRTIRKMSILNVWSSVIFILGNSVLFPWKHWPSRWFNVQQKFNIIDGRIRSSCRHLFSLFFFETEFEPYRIFASIHCCIGLFICCLMLSEDHYFNHCITFKILEFVRIFNSSNQINWKARRICY